MSGPDADYGFTEPLVGLISDKNENNTLIVYIKKLDEVNKDDLEFIMNE